MSAGSVLLAADVSLYRAVRTPGSPSVVRAAQAMSRFGEHALGWLALGTIGALVDRPRRAEWTRATTAVAAAHAANVVVKRVVRRPRPDFADLPALTRVPSKLSFPSAHAASTTAAATAFAPLLPGWPWRATAAAMAVSRVVLGVHYPSDVAAGALLGAVVGRRARRRGR